VTPNGQQVVPDATTRIYQFTGAMINNNPSPPPEAPPPGDCPCANDGDPVNLATGLFTQETTDLTLPDVIPIGVTRTYRQRDLDERPFGIGTSHSYSGCQRCALGCVCSRDHQQAYLFTVKSGQSCSGYCLATGTRLQVFGHMGAKGSFPLSASESRAHPCITRSECRELKREPRHVPASRT
jgi:hypothetical protein